MILRNGVNGLGRNLHYYFDYSAEPVKQPYLRGDGVELLRGKAVAQGEPPELSPGAPPF